MKRYLLIYLSFFLLQILGATPACAASVQEQNTIAAFKMMPANQASQLDARYVPCKLNGANKRLEQTNIFLFEVEEDDERTNKIQSTAPFCVIKISESKGRTLCEKAESYPISSSSRFLYSTQRYISFRAFRV